MALTKRLHVTFDQPVILTQELVDMREAYVSTAVAAGKTDGLWIGDALNTQRDFADQTSAEEFLAAMVSWNPGRNIVSSTITDI